MRSRFAAAAMVSAVFVSCAAPATAGTAATTTVVRVDDGCRWAGGTWYFDGVTGAVRRTGGYAWCVSPTVAYATTTATTTSVAYADAARPAYYPYAAATYRAWTAYPRGYPYRTYGATTGTVAWTSGSVTGVSRASAGYDAWSGNAAAGRSTARHDAATGTYAAGQQAAGYDRYTGDYAYGERGAAYDERAGAAVAGSHGTVGNAYTGNELTGGRGVAYDPATGRAVRVGGVQGENGGVGHVGDDWYVGRNGSVQQLGGNGSRTSAGGAPRTRQRPQALRRR